MGTFSRINSYMNGFRNDSFTEHSYSFTNPTPKPYPDRSFFPISPINSQKLGLIRFNWNLYIQIPIKTITFSHAKSSSMFPLYSKFSPFLFPLFLPLLSLFPLSEVTLSGLPRAQWVHLVFFPFSFFSPKRGSRFIRRVEAGSVSAFPFFPCIFKGFWRFLFFSFLFSLFLKRKRIRGKAV